MNVNEREIEQYRERELAIMGPVPAIYNYILYSYHVAKTPQPGMDKIIKLGIQGPRRCSAIIQLRVEVLLRCQV